MNPVVIKYPLDLTGTSPANKVAGELHSLEGVGNRAFVPNYGPFYTRSLVVKRASNNQVLTKGKHYVAAQLFVEATIRSGKEVCSVIVITDDTIGTDFVIDYQVMGGDYSTSVEAIIQMIEALQLDHRSVEWGSIIGKPEKFPALPHLHDVGDTYGWEYIVAELEAIRQAILVGDEASHGEIYQYIDHYDNLLRTDLQTLQAQVNAHNTNQNNPHNTTKAQVGLGNVPDYPMATAQQAAEGASNQLFTSPLRVREMIQTFAGASLQAHIADKANPHNTTATQVGLGNVQNYSMATTGEAQTGTATDKYMSPALVKAAITTQAVTPLNAHIARTDNPHSTTKAQVQLGNVDNFATATPSQGSAGTATNLFMTPAAVKQAITDQAGSQLAAHTSRTDNPHSVTKAQVQLGNVTNDKQVINTSGNAVKMAWANGELQLTIDSTAMGRVHTTNQPDPNIAAHATRTNNPHNTTAAQVGLGNVPNVGYASEAEAQNGSGNNLMTPFLVAQAIQVRAINPLQDQINNRIVNNSNAQVSTLRLNSSGYFYQDADGSISLQVAGQRYFQFQSNGNYTVHNGRSYAGAGFQPSDRRFKKHVKKATERPLWRQLDFKSWTMKATGEAERGIIAQQLQEVAPDYVSENDHGIGARKVKRLFVNYTGLSFEMAMAAGREIDRLTSEVDELKLLVKSLLAQRG